MENFCFSLYRGERISYIKKGKGGEEEKVEHRIFLCVNNDKENKIEVKYIDKPNEYLPKEGQKNDRSKRIVSVKSLVNFTKYTTDVLGHEYQILKEKLIFESNISGR